MFGMRGNGMLIALALAAGIAGASAAPAPLTWADWVGDYTGKLKWAGCTIDGQPSATVSLDAIDGVIAVDLASAGDALGELSLVEDNAGWRGQKRDVTVKLAHADNALTLAVDLESGCTMRATLKRPSVGIAACDELDAWARIEDHCSRLAKPRLESLARVVRQRSEWLKARGEGRATLATRCKARAAKVATELADVGCAPDPGPASTRGPACFALRQTAAKLSRCTTLPFDLATSLAHDANQLASAVAGAETEISLEVVEKRCRAMKIELTDAAQQAGCSI